VYGLELKEVGQEDEFTVKIGRLQNADFRFQIAECRLQNDGGVADSERKG
jgi:hypothetical protein